MRFHRPPPAQPVISLTPLIDVVFILLIFFMLASSFMDWRSVDLSVSTMGQRAQPNTQDPVIITLYHDGDLGLAGTQGPVANILKHMKQKGIEHSRPILLKPEENVALQQSVSTLEALSLNGFTKVTFYSAQAKDK